MKLSTLIFLTFVAAQAAFGTTAHAVSLRCKGDLAQVGDSKASVVQKCGEPMLIDSFCKPTEEIAIPPTVPGTVNIVPCERVDEWSYNPGPGQFITVLRFEAGTVKSIRYGDRVRE